MPFLICGKGESVLELLLSFFLLVKARYFMAAFLFFSPC